MKIRTAITVAAIVASLLLGGMVLAQSSANFSLWWHVIAGGGDQSASAGYAVSSSIGQPAIGALSSASHRLGAGYWYGISAVPSPPTITFDTGPGTYLSISGRHTGTITPSYNITVSKLYTYPCTGTGGHTEYAAISYSNGTKIAEAQWNGYTSDWHNITFDGSFTLYAGTTYNYTIKTGSYPQIIHETLFNAPGGTITCTEFVDANGKQYGNWIPAIKLE